MPGSSNETGRFVDQGRRLTAYADLIHVVCPGCDGRAAVVPRPDLPPLRYYTELLYRPRRLVCPGCGASREWTAERCGNALVGVSLGGPREPFFGLPLWLQTACRGRVLWAYNDRHLDAIEAYVRADLRERVGPTMSMLDCLPIWTKRASHRSDVLSAIQRLRGQLAKVRPDERNAAHDGASDRARRPNADLYFRPPY